jgi:hypothetical protein
MRCGARPDSLPPVVSTSSSTKRAAKLAQKGKGKKVRFQGGTVFPLAVAVTLILGMALIVWARQTLPDADASVPGINDHWHAAYGFYLCDTWYELAGNLEERDVRGNLTNTKFLQAGIHSHDDSVIHWHPNSSKAVGKRAKLGVFLDAYDVKLTDDSITFPANNELGGKAVWSEKDTKCDGKDAQISVVAWSSYTDTDDGNRYIANMDQVHLDNDNMVFAIIFGAEDAPRVMPPKANELPTLGAADQNSQPTDALSTDASVVTGEVPSDSSGASTTPDSSVPDSTVSSSTTADSSGG